MIMLRLDHMKWTHSRLFGDVNSIIPRRRRPSGRVRGRGFRERVIHCDPLTFLPFDPCPIFARATLRHRHASSTCVIRRRRLDGDHVSPPRRRPRRLLFAYFCLLPSNRWKWFGDGTWTFHLHGFQSQRSVARRWSTCGWLQYPTDRRRRRRRPYLFLIWINDLDWTARSKDILGFLFLVISLFILVCECPQNRRRCASPRQCGATIVCSSVSGEKPTDIPAEFSFSVSLLA